MVELAVVDAAAEQAEKRARFLQVVKCGDGGSGEDREGA